MIQIRRSKLVPIMPHPLRTALRGIRDNIHDALFRSKYIYRLYLWSKCRSNGPKGLPKATWSNAVLKNHQEWQNAVKQLRTLELPPANSLPKNWDGLAALSAILTSTDLEAKILDAGAARYSVILPWLFLYGYRNLIGINPIFQRSFKRGPIRYECGDITQTSFENDTFDVITCMSVIEHGVNLDLYFKEVSRILKPKGLLITSTDYYCDPINTQDLIAYGVPIHIFCRDEISSALNIAMNYGLEMTGKIDLECQEKPVRWEQYDLDYTFLVFTLQKKCSDVV